MIENHEPVSYFIWRVSFMAAALRQKNGFYTIRSLAAAMCTAIVTFGPYLKLYFSNRPTLIAAIDAVSAACATIIVEIDAARADEFPP